MGWVGSKPTLSGLHELLRPCVIEALGNAFFAAQLSYTVLPRSPSSTIRILSQRKNVARSHGGCPLQPALQAFWGASKSIWAIGAVGELRYRPVVPSPCLRRVKQLEESGHISHYVAILDRRKIGLGMMAYVEVKVPRLPMP